MGTKILKNVLEKLRHMSVEEYKELIEGFQEECWFLYGIRIGSYFIGIKRYHSIGSEASVDFSWKKAMNPLFLGWVHTHPAECGTNPSCTDLKTMRSWVKGLNRAMICGISSKGENSFYDFFRDGIGINTAEMKVKKFYNIHIGLGYRRNY